ncbi:MAG: tail fiber protein [Pseudomonadota bacterium]
MLGTIVKGCRKMDPLLGTIIMFGGNFAPRGWAFCQGQLLAISSNSALFSILGTTYGGDGRSTFALPDLRGRFPTQQGNGPGVDIRTLGQRGGADRYTMTTAQLPSHEHTGNLVAEGAAATDANPTGRFLGVPAAGEKIYEADGAGPAINMATGTINVNATGGSQPYEVSNPFLGLNFIIALQGVFPSRS